MTLPYQLAAAPSDPLSYVTHRTGTSSDGRLLLTGGGARFASVRRALASLTGRPVEVADLNESVAAGACVQAAAIALGEPHRVVRAGWSIGTASVTDPDPAVDAAELRARYAAARDRPGAA